MQVLDIIEGTTVDGPGLRTAIYFAGCRHACPGCHNPQSWDMDGGSPMSVEEIAAAVEAAGFRGITFSGGDPLYQAEPLAILAETLRHRGHDLWCYTGFLWEEIVNDPRFRRLLSAIDVLVDGPFIQALRDASLPFRGSSNQRLILARESLALPSPRLWDPALLPEFCPPSGRTGIRR